MLYALLVDHPPVVCYYREFRGFILNCVPDHSIKLYKDKYVRGDFRISYNDMKNNKVIISEIQNSPWVDYMISYTRIVWLCCALKKCGVLEYEDSTGVPLILHQLPGWLQRGSSVA